jgi:hypothetical protein
MALATWASRGLQPPGASAPSLSAPYAVVFLGGFLGSLFLTGAINWWLLNPVRNPYRQAMLSVVSVCAAFLLGLVTQPVDMMFGRSGLLALAAVAALIAFWLWGRVRRARGSG